MRARAAAVAGRLLRVRHAADRVAGARGTAPQPGRRNRARAAAKPLVCTGLAVALLVTPVQPRGSLDQVVGGSSALAQSPDPPYLLGTPKPCPLLRFPGLESFAEDGSLVAFSGDAGDPYPTLWKSIADRSVCILELPACPISPIGNRPMWPSVASATTEADFGHLDLRPAANGLWRSTYADLGLDRYPEFCEDRVDMAQDAGAFTDCTNERGVVVTTYGGGTGCRVLTPLQCPDPAGVGVGMHRSGAQSCRAVQRRGWDCPSGYEPANTFNSCYKVTPIALGQHPACEAGRPAFPIGPSQQYLRENSLDPKSLTRAQQQDHACAEYVDEDFTDQRPCSWQGGPNDYRISFQNGNNSYWCRYDSWLLRPECHAIADRPQDCSNAGSAFCLKRASRTGGCDQVAQTIWCRVVEAARRRGDPSATLEVLEAFGCNPCPSLPFSETPSNCPRPATNTGRPLISLLKTLEVRGDLDYTTYVCAAIGTREEYLASTGCRDAPACSDPPRGRIEWESEHYSELAVVNSSIVVRVVDIPIVQRRDDGWMNLGYDLKLRPTRPSPRINYNYTEGDEISTLRLRGFASADAGRSYSAVSERATEGSALVCEPRNDPIFHLRVQELWPDQEADQEAIRALGGSDALAWWDGLSFQQRRAATEARGLKWHEALTTQESAATCLPSSARPPCRTWDRALTPEESEVRNNALTTVVECRYDDFRTCVWHPREPGYYWLIGGGAWRMQRSFVRDWHHNGALDQLQNWLDSSQSNRDRFHTLLRTSVREILRATERDADGNLKYHRYTPLSDIHFTCDQITDLALQSGLEVTCLGTGQDPNVRIDAIATDNRGDRDWLFIEEAVARSVCVRALDIRVRCNTVRESGNYTETEPVGVIVHEVRVQTVTPTR